MGASVFPAVLWEWRAFPSASGSSIQIPGLGGPSSPPRGGCRLACASAALSQSMAHLLPVLFPVQQAIENHILKLFQSNLVPTDPE